MERHRSGLHSYVHRQHYVTAASNICYQTLRHTCLSFTLCSLFLWPAFVNAACPPLIKSRTEPSFLEQLARHTPKDRPFSGQELSDLTRAGNIKLPTLVVFPPNGPVPLTVTVYWSLLTKGSPSIIELDVEGKGSFRSTDSFFDPNSGIQEGKLNYIYERGGTFQPTLRARDEKGNVRTYQRQVVVKSKVQFETDLKTIWADFKTALRQRNIAAALNCTHASAREKYTKILPAVLKSQTPIDTILKDIKFDKLAAGSAEFEMLVKEGNDLVSYMVVFMIDEDGIWRIQFF